MEGVKSCYVLKEILAPTMKRIPGTPRKPQNLRIFGKSDNGVLLEWEEPKHGPPPHFYQVYVYSIVNEKFQTVEQFKKMYSGSLRSVKISAIDLETAMVYWTDQPRYLFLVTACNNVGASSPAVVSWYLM